MKNADRMAMNKYGVTVINPATATDHILGELVSQIAQKKSEILDDFMFTYIISRLEDFKKDPSKLRRLELVEQRTKDGSIYFFRIKSGRPKKKA